MLKKRLIPCLDVKDGFVVKGVRFKNHDVLGDVCQFAKKYNDEGADELVFYDIMASPQKRVVEVEWVKKLSDILTIPFCIAGGIRSLEDASKLLDSGAEKVSINSMALENPELITKISNKYGSQALVVGIDSYKGDVYQYTGDPSKSKKSKLKTLSWVKQAIDRGAGEIVVNSMNFDGIKNGYDIEELSQINEISTKPIVASGGAGKVSHFKDVFKLKNVTGALAASIFHKDILPLSKLRKILLENEIPLRRFGCDTK